MAVTYLRLFDPTQQFQLKNGAINVAGLLKVKLEGTDDYAPVFDEDGTQLAQPVILDNNGRSKGLFVDSAKVYWLEVDDRDGYELFTIRKMTPCGGGGGSSLGSKYEVISTDGTVVVDRYSEDGTVYFDLSTAFTTDSATWGATFATVNSIAGDNDWAIIPVATSTGTSQWSNGWTAEKDCCADIAATIEMTGDSSAISTVDVMCVFTVDGVDVSTEYGLLDPSESKGKISFEYKGELQKDQVIDCRFFVKSVEAMSPTLVAKAYFNEECDGIVGGGGGNYTAGDYVEITSAKVINVTGVQPLSGMSAYATQSAFDDCCSAMSGYVSSLSSQVSSLESSVSSISSTVSGLTGTYVEISSISGYSSIWNSASAVPNKLDESAFTAYTSTAQGFTGVTTDSTLTGNGTSGSALGVNKMELVFDSSMNTSISGDSAIVGVNSAIMSGKLDNSASSTWYPLTGNPSGFLTEHQSLSGYVEKSSISAESSQWNDVSSKIPWSALSGDGTKITGISGSAIGGTDYSAGEYVSITGDTISVTGLQPVSGMSAYVEQSSFDDCCSAMSGYVSALQDDVSGISSVVSGLTGLTGNYVEKSSISAQSSQWNEISSLSSYVEKSSISAQSSQWNEVSGLSGKLDNSASSTWYPMTGNPSGFLTEHQDLSGYVEKSSISAESSNWNEVSAMMPWSALSGDGTSITGISGSAIKGHEYSGIAPIVVDNTAETIAVNYSGLALDSSMSATASGSDIVIGVAGGIFLEATALGTGVI